jgi:hypothetical protein
MLLDASTSIAAEVTTSRLSARPRRWSHRGGGVKAGRKPPRGLRAAARTGVDGADAAWTILWMCESWAPTGRVAAVPSDPPRLRPAGVCVDNCTCRAGPREHGRQAARSKRDRPERASE